MRSAPPLQEPSGTWQVPIARPAMMMEPDSFRFLNRIGRLEARESWNDPGRARLWLYNLHYFDDLNAEGSAERAHWHSDLMARWVAENPPGYGAGWEPYPLSLRIANWIKWALAGNELEQKWCQSLSVQVRYLSRRLEWHLLGNHLLANAKALLFAGLFFKGEEADAWRAEGLAILGRELPEQVLADGGHFELSPMYHCIILEDLADLINLANAYPDIIPRNVVDGWKTTVQCMHHWLQIMTHPDGQIAFFNDSAFGIAPEPVQLLHYANSLGLVSGIGAPQRVTHLQDTGYVRVQQGEMAAIFDVARVGPDYLPGHAHADTLSFELSLFGQRVIVNSGTSQYGTGPERLRQRSTAAHNTVEVDGENSSEVWSGFRMARRAHPTDLEIQNLGDIVTVQCSHDGYQRLPGRVVHTRKWNTSERTISVSDSLKGKYRQAIARYHLHPDLEVQGTDRQGHLSLPNGQQVNWTVSGGTAKLASSTWHPEFGASVQNQCINVSFASDECTMEFTW